MAKPQNKKLKVSVVKGQLVIAIPVKTLAWAFDHSEFAQPFNETSCEYRQIFKVVNPTEFARDVRSELEQEGEDGTTPVHRLLDAACEAAVNNGSLAVEDIDEPADETPHIKL